MPPIGDKKKDEMLGVNANQAQFYNSSAYRKSGNLFLRVWRNLRYSMQELRKGIGAEEEMYEIHKAWIGNLSNKKILDLGCYYGNFLSSYLAQNAKIYIALDLCEPAIKKMNENFAVNKQSNAKAFCLDFLSSDFQEYDFDVIYAHAVAHHFKHFDVFINEAAKRLKPDGIMITFDPLNTSFGMRIIRALYRPFQQDRDWEFPFTKLNFDVIKKKFTIIEMQGFMGVSKFAYPIMLLNKIWGIKIGKRLHLFDKKHTKILGSALWRCLQVSLLLKRR